MSRPYEQLAPNDARQVELLRHYRPWLRTVAASLTGPNQAEDLASEGWVALWRAHRDYDGSSPLDYWLKHKARRRMLTVLRDWHTVQRNLKRGAKPLDIAAGNPSAELTENDITSVWAGLAVELPEVELAYHYGEISDALSALTPREREYVHLRFWRDYGKPNMIAHFGYEPTGLWRTAKKKLTGQLAHLAEVAA